MEETFYEEYFRIEDRHWWFVGRRRIIATVLAELPSGDGDGPAQNLHLGCGTGAMLEHLRRFGSVRGLDADRRAVDFCRSRGERRVDVLESSRLPVADASLDLVTAFDVLEHIEDDRGALAEIARVLRPGGALLATVPAYRWMWGPQDEISHHFRRYGRDELVAKIRASGLRPRRITHFNTILLPAIAAIRLGRRLLPPRELRSDFELNRDGIVNDLLARVFSFEARLLSRWDLPAGVSILALASAPGPER
jgi:SAM-dependent methyltransferase